MKRDGIFILLLALTYLSAKSDPIGNIYSINGFVQIVSADKNVPPSQAIMGRTIHSDDIIRTAADSFCKIIYNDRNSLVIIDPSTEVKLSDTKLSRSIHLNFGGLYVKNAQANRKKTFIFTTSSQIKLLPSELWMKTTVDGGDEIHVIKKKLEVFNVQKNQKLIIPSGNVAYSYKDGFFETIETNEEDLPQYLFNSQLLSLHQKKNPSSFKIEHINYRSHDLIPLFGIGRWREKIVQEDSGFGMDILFGNLSVGGNSYSKIGVFPSINKKNFKLRLNLDGYMSTSASAPDLNTIDDVFDVLDHVSYLQYRTEDRNLFFQMGSIDGITFGHGNLVKEYSNILDYPRSKKTGLYMYYTTDKRNYTFDFFTASLRDLQNGGGLMGFHASMFLSEHFPLTIGLGYVKDLNQFAAISDFISDERIIIKEFSRGINALEMDFTMDLLHTFYFDVYVYGEGVGVWFPETHYYIREPETFEEAGEELVVPEGMPKKVWRDGTWGLTAPGIWLKYSHFWEFRFAFNTNSALHIPQYFGTTYDYERVRYAHYEFSEDEKKDGAEEIQEMLSIYQVNTDYEYDADTVNTYLLPKDIYTMTDSSQIKFPSFGYSVEAVYHFKELVDANLSLAYFNEYSDTEGAQTFYNYHLSIALKDNVLEYVTEAKCYYSQYFTNTPFDKEKYHENLLRGIRVGVKVYKNLSIIADYHDVFYDTDLDGIVDLVRTGGIDVMVKF